MNSEKNLEILFAVAAPAAIESIHPAGSRRPAI